MKKPVEPILSDFTPGNPFLPPMPEWLQPSYKQLLVTTFICIGVTAAFFAAVHFWL